MGGCTVYKEKPIAVIFCGAPGSGKGLLRQRIVEVFGWQGAEMSAILRADSIFQTESVSYLSNMDEGELLPDTLVTDALQRYLDANEAIKSGANIVFDGATRTLTQLKFLSKWLVEKGYISHFFRFDIPEEMCRQRIGGRAAEQKRADDKKPTSVDNRFTQYYRHLPSVEEELRKTGRLFISIDAEASPEEVFREFCLFTGLATQESFVEK